MVIKYGDLHNNNLSSSVQLSQHEQYDQKTLFTITVNSLVGINGKKAIVIRKPLFLVSFSTGLLKMYIWAWYQLIKRKYKRLSCWRSYKISIKQEWTSMINCYYDH